MKIIITLTSVLAVSLALPTVDVQWAQFKAVHNKQYESHNEELRRQTIFNEKILEIEEHNKLFDQGLVTYKKGVNQFTDMTKEEFLAYVNLGQLVSLNSTVGRVPYQRPANVELPAKVDWREQGIVTEVKDQGQCGSCWSFSATGALEGQHALSTGKLVSLSEQNLMDCSARYGNAACNGGWMGSAFEYVHDNGIETEADYPYETKVGRCRYSAKKSVMSVKSYVDLPEKSEPDLMTAVATIGPIAIGLDATDVLQSYASGYLYDPSCSQNDLNHGVLVVGYGEENGREYWLVKNSWGVRWGEEGYFKLARNRNNDCGVASAAEYPIL